MLGDGDQTRRLETLDRGEGGNIDHHPGSVGPIVNQEADEAPPTGAGVLADAGITIDNEAHGNTIKSTCDILR